MGYRIGQRVRPKGGGVKVVILLLLGSLLIGTLANAYADSRGRHLISHGLSMKHNRIAKTTNPIVVSGSAHTAAGRQVEPNSILAPLSDLETASCTQEFSPPTPGLASAASAELRKLVQYQLACNGSLAARDSFFVPTPATVSAAKSDASDVATKLKEYARFGVKPLVFMEPDTDSGSILDLKQYQAGAYDAALDAYFAAIKADGITDGMMGMWVAFPEGNLPVWNNTNPVTYAANVTKVIQLQKKYFPASQAAILLDSETYPSGTSWSNGQYVSLLPYVQKLPKGLVDSFGLQGFPWAPPAGQAGAVYSPQTYLRVNFAAEAARALGISSVWLNTGSFSQMYTNSNHNVTVSSAQRQVMLNGVLAQANVLKAQGFTVAIHLFAQDKSNTPEAINWSYWKAAPGSDANTAVFTTFAHEAAVNKIPLWLFDTYEQ